MFATTYANRCIPQSKSYNKFISHNFINHNFDKETIVSFELLFARVTRHAGKKQNYRTRFLKIFTFLKSQDGCWLFWATRTIFPLLLFLCPELYHVESVRDKEKRNTVLDFVSQPKVYKKSSKDELRKHEVRQNSASYNINNYVKHSLRTNVFARWSLTAITRITASRWKILCH